MTDTKIAVKDILPSVKGTEAQAKLFTRLGENAVRNVANQILSDFQASVKHWKEPVEFKIVRSKDKSKVMFTAETSNTIYGYVNYGTEPHIIKPKPTNPRQMLFFKTGGQAKTQVGTLQSGKGKMGTNPVAARKVHHPGTEARRFDLIVRKRAYERLIDEKNKMLRLFRQQTTRPSRR